MDQQNQGMGNSNPSQEINPRKLFVGNLSWKLTSDDLRQIFSEFGTVEDAIVLTEKFSGRSKGFGFVTMSTDEEAQAAIEGLHEKDVEGRNMVVNVAQPPRPREERRFDDRRGGGSSRGGYSNNRSSGGDRGGFSNRGGSRRDY
jgi:cold-inducible RNA-binding protein